ncbi:Tubulin tyrosine ligase-like 5 [Giardia duodenalis]|uniref:Tubulin--tyrosine ligase-like protein 5 n=1 Tax=Giardia intestinalis (strain ATCC 50803 / WB clone C6) TaxID=184922 RepID=A0A644F505_GIAIC|nr:Tubulin tyrosine ligase-like 5 [Giardia intestinalis]KAE8303492.1 Tubulin tyrosine ligase-like 5 [Giardia intestinalis]
MYSAKPASKSPRRLMRPLSANLGVAVSYDMVVIGHGAGGQSKSHFSRTASDVKARSNSSKQQKITVSRPNTSQGSLKTVARTPLQRPAPRPRSTNLAVRPLLTQSLAHDRIRDKAHDNTVEPKLSLPTANDLRIASQVLKQTPLLRPSTATTISAIMASRTLRARGKVDLTPQLTTKQSVITPSPTDTPACSPLHAYCNIEPCSSILSTSPPSATESRCGADAPSYKGIDALLLQLKKEAVTPTELPSSPTSELPLTHTVCGGVSSENVRAEFRFTDVGNSVDSLGADLMLVAEQTKSDTVTDSSLIEIQRVNTPQARCKTPRSAARRSVSNRLHLIRQPGSTKSASDETLINTEEVESGYQLLLLECPTDIVTTFLIGLDWFHREKSLETFIVTRGLDVLPPVFTLVHKSHFYTYSAILKYDFRVFWSWRTKLDRDFYSALHPDQLVNHFPNITNITRKDMLWKGYQLLRTCTPAASKALPETFLLPADYPKLKAYVAGKGEMPPSFNRDSLIFIVKPLALSRGRQIQLFRDPSEIEYSVPSLAQIYITNAMLINRRKVDFRLYVGLFFNAQERSYSAFLFRDGIARLCSREYDINNIQCLRAHLTNTSINGEHETAFLKARMPYTDALSILSVTYNVDKAIMEALIKRVIIIGILTGIVGTSNIGGMHQMEACFELLGADILLSYDAKTRAPHAHLLEFNASPSLAINCPLDKEVKPKIVSAMLSLAVANASGFLSEFAEVIKEQVDPLIPSKQYEVLRTSIKRGSASGLII